MAGGKSKRQKPKVSSELEEIRAEDCWRRDGFIENVRIVDGILGGEEARVVFDGCHLKDVSFANATFHEVEFVDVIFETCDFSNVQLEHAVFHRCEIRGSKLTGANLANSKLSHTLFQACDGRYVNFSFAELKIVDFLECHLPDADLYECVGTGFRFDKCQIDNINLAETDLDGVDLSTSTYDRLEVTLTKVAGCIVSREQAMGFARMLGLTVKEE